MMIAGESVILELCFADNQQASLIVRAVPRRSGLFNPALIEQRGGGAESIENRIADRITAFSGSMRFVYLHVDLVRVLDRLGVEAYPFGLLTMIVSLEAIFLSTFVMISQNRADAKREVLANQQWETVQDEDKQNEELLRLSRQILELTRRCTSTRRSGRKKVAARALPSAPARCRPRD